MHPDLSENLVSALRLAEIEARELNQEFVTTEHLLLGIMSVQDCTASRALQATADVQKIRESILRSLPKLVDVPLITGRLPLSPKAQRSINNAMTAAESAKESSVPTRLVLAALVAESQTAIESALRAGGADIDQLLRLLREKTTVAER